MLVLGSRGTGAVRWRALGSVSRYAAAHACCPVVVIRGETAAVHQLVGIGIGDLDTCASSLAFAVEEASVRKASLMAIHAISRAGSPAPDLAGVDADADRQLTELVDTWRNKYPDVPVSHDVVRDRTSRALAGLSARADLIVVGRHAEHPGPGPGSVGHAVLNDAPGPVAVVPSSLRPGGAVAALTANLGRMRPVRLAVILDCCCVLLFVIIGRASHAKGENLAGVASTAWPFLAGLAGGWLAARAWQRPFAFWPAGVGVWLGTVAAGLALRVVAGQGTAFAFAGVALAFLGLFLLGWRLAARYLRLGTFRPGARS